MSHFPDTSFLCSLYRMQEFSTRAVAWQKRHVGPIHTSSFLLLELRQSLRLHGWLHTKDKARGIPAREGASIQQQIQSDLSSGLLEVVPVNWAEVHQIAETLSSKHTLAHGHRLADLLHVATAIHLGASDFLTFDGNQKRLALAEGMTVPL